MEGLESMNASQIVEKLFEIEKDLNLFEKKIQGVYFWKLIRFEVYQFILIQHKLITVDKKSKSTFLGKFSRIFKILKNSYYYPSCNKKVESIILENPRKIKDENNKYYDPYTKYFIDELSAKSISYEIVDLGFGEKHYEKASLNRRFADNFYFDVICKIFDKKIKITEKEKKVLEELNSKFKFIFEIELNLNSIVFIKLENFI